MALYRKEELFIKKTTLPAPVEEVFAWHCRQGALQRLNPPWEEVTVLEQTPDLKDGSRTVFLLKAGPLQIKWVAEHRDYIENRRFKDVQIRGPFSAWEHTHIFEPHSKKESILEDRIRYSLPFHFISRFIAGKMVRQKLEKMFIYRHRITREDLNHIKEIKRKSIALTGSSGFLGAALLPYWKTQGHDIVILSRKKENAPGTAYWDPADRILDFSFEDIQTVVHLAGEPIGEGIWTEKKKERILKSRIDGTRLIAEKIASLKNPPETLICASAIGYYGNRGNDLMTEESGPGNDFISDVCRQWEEAARPAADKGIRVVFLRIGVVLSPGGGALKKLLLPFSLGLGGPMGKGTQYMSWITRDDLIRAIDHILHNKKIKGPVNLVSPAPVTNRELSKTLARVLKRPAILRVPAWLIKLVFGQMGREVLLSSARVSPKKLVDSGFKFNHPLLERALLYLTGKQKKLKAPCK